MSTSSISGTGAAGAAQQFDPAQFLNRITNRFLKKNDTDGDGNLSAQELQGLSADAFKALDTNGDGKLSADEIKGALSKALDSLKNARSSSDPSSALSALDNSPEGQLLKLAGPHHHSHHRGPEQANAQDSSQQAGGASSFSFNYTSIQINVTQNIYTANGTPPQDQLQSSGLNVTA